jgi:hypothetical protein
VLDADPRRIKRLRINAVQRDEADAATGEEGAADKRSRAASLDGAVTNGA